MNLAVPYTRAVLTNGTLWFWGVIFCAFWFVLGAYVFSGGLADTHASEAAYTAAWFAVITLFSLTTLSMSIAGSITYGTSSLAYSFRYTRLTPRGYSVALVVAAMTMGVILTTLMIVVVSWLFSAHFGTLILPRNPLLIVGVAALAGAFMMGLAVCLVLLVVNYLGLRNMSFVGFVPLILAYIFGFAQLFLHLPAWFLYLSPWNDIESLLYQGFGGSPANAALAPGNGAPLLWTISAGALVAWILALGAIASLLLGRIRSVSLQEGRQI